MSIYEEVPMATAKEPRTGVEPSALSAEWYAAYRNELFDENGDPDGLLSTYREEAEASLPDSVARKALALLMERIREEDADLELDDSEPV